MPILSSVFLVAALVLAVVIGPQTRPWTWGPAMLALGVSALAALPVFWKRGKFAADFGVLAIGALTAGWFAWRAWLSPVADLGQADLLLVGGAVAAFVSIRGIAGNVPAERILIWGIALLLLANVAVAGKQLIDPSFTPVFRTRGAEKMVSGFFAHYNEAANYFIASSMLVGAAALFGRHRLATRIIWILIAAAGLAAVYFTRSRGGILGAAVACGVLAAIALIVGKRQKARWFAPAVIAVPIVGISIAAFLFVGWQDAQEARQHVGGIEGLMDNTIRLYLLGIALTCIGTHPWTGGGSRSFSWECYRFWEKAEQGAGGHRPELVHNELFQAATDYGFIGAGLLIGLFGTLAIAAVIRIVFEESTSESDNAWRLGALAGLAGMLVQSCFSFVFHLMPGAILLGVCLGQLSKSATRLPNAQTWGTRIVLTIAAIACAVLLFPPGWKGTQITRILWPSYFGKHAIVSAESHIDALTGAIAIWPQAPFYQERGAIFQTLAASGEASKSHEFMKLAAADYQETSRRHPFDPAPAVNRANLLSQLRQDAEAEEWYAKTIALQGGMEPGFRGHYYLARHLFQKGLRLFQTGSAAASRDAFENAALEIEEAVKLTPGWVIGNDGRNIRISIHENLGAAREAAGDREGALQAYDFAATIPTGARAHYRAGVLIGKIAVEAWSDRKPSEALARFIEARKRIGQAGGSLPQGVTPGQRAEYIAYLDQAIAFLKGAKVQPEE